MPGTLREDHWALPELPGPLAVYTTIYPGVEPYLGDWYRSICDQTDKDFELWIGLDQLGSEGAKKLFGSDVSANWVKAPSGSTPAQVRQQALERVVETCAGVVLVDSDDVLHSTRVASARAQLQTGELAGCALCLIDEQGGDLGITFDLPRAIEAEDVLPRNNVFGFSNSAFRSGLMKQCLPIPPDAVLIDWYLATRAWLFGAKLAFDRIPRMNYRQHPGNTARVRCPFGRDQVVSDTAIVRRHFALFKAEPSPDFLPDRYALLVQVAQDVEEFYKHVVSDRARLDRYVMELNDLQPVPLWWSCVANPALEHMWNYKRALV